MKTEELAAELRAEGSPASIAEAVLIETGITRMHYDLLQAAKAAGVAPSDFILALHKHTLATIHATCKMVNDEEFTKGIQVLLLESALTVIPSIGAKW